MHNFNIFYTLIKLSFAFFQNMPSESLSHIPTHNKKNGSVGKRAKSAIRNRNPRRKADRARKTPGSIPLLPHITRMRRE